MHTLHAILVDLTDGLFGAALEGYTADELKDEARDRALHETERYGDEKVFDWRSKTDAGRWSDDFPSNVVLGREEPERLVALVEKHCQRPLKEAFLRLEMYKFRDCEWRTKEQIEAENFTVIENPQNGTDGLYWSGRPRPPVTLDESFLKDIWNADPWDYDAWLVRRMVNLVSGEYEDVSGFYSVPDRSAKISKRMLVDVKKNPGKYALVFLDYHN